MTTSLQPGAVIDGKYRLIRKIGEGGMGTVFEGENIRIKRKVAIKLLHEHVAGSSEFAQRFEREARASARIGSPYICDVLDLGDLESGEKYIVMELLEGESFEEKLTRDKKLTLQELAPLAFEMLEGLGAMHQVGVVHRDLKPANVFLCKRQSGEVSVKILDFGVAKVAARAGDESSAGEMTTTGTMMGTPLYMSPEQARGARDVDGRTDLYAASVIFYRAITGVVPHEGTSLHELLFKIVLDEPKPIKSLAPEIDDEFAALVTKGLDRDADNRFSSAREYQEAIAKWGAQHDLQFKVTLPKEPPPLRQQTGGFPKAIIETAGAALRSGNTPLSVEPKTTPTAVADTQPVLSKPPEGSQSKVPVSALASTAPPAPVGSVGDTLLAGPTKPTKPDPIDDPRPKTPAPAPSVSPKSSTSGSSTSGPASSSKGKSQPPPAPASSKNTIIIGAIVAIAAAIIGMKLGTSEKAADPQPPASTTAPTFPPPTLSTIPTAPSVADAAAAATAPSSVGGTIPTLNPRPLMVPGPSRPDAAAAMPTASGRTIRTDPGF